MSTPSTITVVKDITSYLGGWALLAHQVLYVEPSQVNESFLWVAVGLIGVPSLTQLWQMRGGGAGTAASPPGPDSPPSPRSPSPSPTASGGDR